MKRDTSVAAIAVMLLVGFSCGGQSPTDRHKEGAHDHGEHAHDHGEAGDRDHGDSGESSARHDHGEGGTEHGAHDAAGDPPEVSVTHWTDRTELFMEYPALVAGRTSRAALHVTRLEDFAPLSGGKARVVMRSGRGAPLEFGGRLIEPGIYGAELRVHEPGVYRMTVTVDASGLRTEHELGPVIVHGDATALPHGPHAEQGTSFLKEQQWTLEFGTVKAESRALRSSTTVPAVIRPRAGGQASLTAPVPGRIDPASEVVLPGQSVSAGAALVRVLPRSEDLRDGAGLRAALVEAEQEHGLAVRERDRAERLVEGRALPARRLGEADAALASSTARLQAARERWQRFQALSATENVSFDEGVFTVRAPFDGIVSEMHFAPGETVHADQLLVRVVDPERLHVVGSVPESSTAALSSVEAGELLVEGGEPVPLGQLVSVGRVIDPRARTTPVRFEIPESDGRLMVGQRVRLRLFLGRETSAMAVPESAVVQDAGRPVVFVQRGGETFERRLVRLGSRAGGWVHVLAGVEPGERVVSRGAYLVRLASMSTQVPAHGHVH